MMKIDKYEKEIKKGGDIFVNYFNELTTNMDLSNNNIHYSIANDYLDYIKYISEYHLENFHSHPKGFPYYWIGFLLFKSKHYEQAVFYLDAALAEDKHYMNYLVEIEGAQVPKWITSGAASFFQLHNFEGEFEEFNIPELKCEVNKFLDVFNDKNIEGINIDLYRDFIKKFVDKFIKSNNTAILTTLYSFIMEKKDIDNMIIFKSSYGGTIEPMILHLAKGALVFESILKTEYLNDRSKVTLGIILKDDNFKGKMKLSSEISSSIADINDIEVPVNNFSIVDSFTCTSKIRNTSAHNLCWNDNFISKYDRYFEQVLFSIFYFIFNEYIDE